MKEVAETLRYLADKLGTTAEKLWPSLVEYERISAQYVVSGFKWFWIIAPIIWIGGTIGLAAILDEDDMAAGWFVINGLVLVVAGVITAIGPPGNIAATKSPEAAAILKLLGK